MHFADALRSAVQSILSHKLRSLLTLTGIVIGVLAVVSMFSSVYALKALVKNNMEGMGWNYSIVITADRVSRVSGPRGLSRAIRRANQSVQMINYDDLLALRENIPHKSMYGMIENNVLIRLGNQDKYVRLRATDADFFVNKSYPILLGRYYNSYENDNLLPVAVLGSIFAKEQYGDENPVGKTISLGKYRFSVVGVLADDELNSGGGMNFNSSDRSQDLQSVFVPLRYGVHHFGTNKGLHMIYMQGENEAQFRRMKTQARQLLLSRHNMFPNFSFMDIGDVLLTVTAEMDSVMKKWNITLFAIASISLIVGGIGLFSTLLISIQERMTEIGVRKSIGATESDIFFYFIFEAVTLAMIGAILGIFSAWLILIIISQAIDFPLFLPIQGVAVGLSFSFLVGVISGIYPAIKAARIDPIKAIYYME
ncbi:MAG: ABC transporter permease [Candidatus Cloacimonadaceae bacterium]|nr:ABC transporter permease [Candidatus Cloacimonadaceae bacterium]